MIPITSTGYRDGLHAHHNTVTFSRMQINWKLIESRNTAGSKVTKLQIVIGVAFDLSPVGLIPIDLIPIGLIPIGLIPMSSNCIKVDV